MMTNEQIQSRSTNRNVAREVLTGGRIKGGMVKAHLSWLAENRSAQDKELFMQRLTPETRQTFSAPVLATNWYPFSILIEVDRALMDLFGNGKLEFLRELGRYSARINLSTAYRAFDRDTNHEFFRNSALLHSQFQDFGKARYEQTGEKSGRMIHTEYTCYSPLFCASALGYYEGCITSHGVARAVVTEPECHCYGGKSCTYDMKWE